MRQLFGGAIVCEFPSTYEDVSLLREIPNNEEVFHEIETDSSVVIELVEYQDGISDEEICKFHFENIAEINQAKSSRIERSVRVDRPHELFKHFDCCTGVQTGIIKFRELDPIGNDVQVSVGVARIKDLNLEIVVTVSAPLSISQTSSSHELGSIPNAQLGQEVFKNIIATLRILDYGLFA